MFNLSDLKKTSFDQEIFEEAQAEAKQRKKAAILRMASRGLPKEEIGYILRLAFS